jgi:hypothetical protein
MPHTVMPIVDSQRSTGTLIGDDTQIAGTARRERS